MCGAFSLFLQVITNCVCAPDQSLTTAGGFWPQQLPGPSNRVLTRMWQVVQNNNGIKVRADLCSNGCGSKESCCNRFGSNGFCFIELCYNMRFNVFMCSPGPG